MKKALAFFSVIIFASSSHSDNLLSDSKLRMRPARLAQSEDFPALVNADNQQYNSSSIFKDLHYPLQTLPRKNPETPLSLILIHNQQNIQDISADNSLYELKQMIKQGGKDKKKEKGQKQRTKPSFTHPGYCQHKFGGNITLPHKMRKEYQKK